jgi:O-antigen biosynthesis protein
MTEFTGERLVPGQVNQDLWAEHISRYTLAARFAAGKRVLDIGSGAGDGTAFLAQHAKEATGVDVAPDTVEHARQQDPLPNLQYIAASAASIPLPDASFDLITAFEVIEHIEQWPELIREARRLLAPGGVFFVSTPNVHYYTESRGKSGPNPYHVHEFEYAEFRDALAAQFPHTSMLLQNRVDAFAFYPPNQHLSADAFVEPAKDSPDDAYFFLGVCSVEQAVDLRSFVYVSQTSNLLREREHHIASLEKELTEVRAHFTQLLADHDALEKHLAEKNEWADKLNGEIELARQRLAQLQKEFEERTAWALQLNARVDKFENSRWVKIGRKLGRGQEFD